jgi:hypothetical protein
MAGLVPAIHVLGFEEKQDVDARDKRGHDGEAIMRDPTPSLRANGSRECAPDDKLREAIHGAAKEVWIASSQGLLAMTA